MTSLRTLPPSFLPRSRKPESNLLLPPLQLQKNLLLERVVIFAGEKANPGKDLLTFHLLLLESLRKSNNLNLPFRLPLDNDQSRLLLSIDLALSVQLLRLHLLHLRSSRDDKLGQNRFQVV
jgi:hypothetical protein